MMMIEVIGKNIILTYKEKYESYGFIILKIITG